MLRRLRSSDIAPDKILNLNIIARYLKRYDYDITMGSVKN